MKLTALNATINALGETMKNSRAGQARHQRRRKQKDGWRLPIVFFVLVSSKSVSLCGNLLTFNNQLLM
jgi:hypothetical protein